MIYTYLTKKAMRLSFAAHKNQLDKSGIPYVYHPFHLAEQMDTEDAVAVALLHDVAEDSDYTINDMIQMGFPPVVTDALSLLTHDENTPYQDYIAKLKSNPIARAVKLADLRHNSDLTRLENPGESDLRRIEKYKKAIRLLCE